MGNERGNLNAQDQQAAKHKFVFETFLDSCTPIMAEVVNVEYPRQADEQFADVKTVMRDNSVVEWQLGSWLDQDQMRAAKKREHLDTKLREVFSTIPNSTKSFRLCLVLPRGDAPRFQKADVSALSAELQHLLKEEDSDWIAQPHLQSPQGKVCRDFTNYQTLLKYLHSLWLAPVVEGQDQSGTRHQGQSWIEMENWGGAYNPLTAVEALRQIIVKRQRVMAACKASTHGCSFITMRSFSTIRRTTMTRRLET